MMNPIPFFVLVFLVLFASSVPVRLTKGGASEFPLRASDKPLFHCKGNNSFTITPPNSTNLFELQFGCDGYFSKSMTSWTFKNFPQESVASFNRFNLAIGDSLRVTYGNQSFNYIGSLLPPRLQVQAGLDLKVDFISTGASDVYPGFSAYFRSAPYTLLPTNTFLSNASVLSGGFTYFKVSESHGLSANFQVTVKNFKGVKGIGAFVSRGTFPSFVQSDATNSSTSTGPLQTVSLNLSGVFDDDYYFAIYLYGTASSLDIICNWNFNSRSVSNGQVVSGTTNVTYQFRTACSGPDLQVLNIQATRGPPGGFPIFYFGSGYYPSSTKNDFVLDTNESGYFDVNVNYTCLTTSSLGSYSTVKLISIESPDSSGYVLQVTWGNSTTQALGRKNFRKNVIGN